MLQPGLQVELAWKRSARVPARLRARLSREVEEIAWTLSQMEALMHDAQRLTELDHPYLMPALELKLPLYDMGRRYRIVFSHVERHAISLVDEETGKIAEIRLL